MCANQERKATVGQAKNKRDESPLDLLGSMPALPSAWEEMPVQNDISRPLGPGHRWPLTMYRQVTIADVNELLARQERR